MQLNHECRQCIFVSGRKAQNLNLMIKEKLKKCGLRICTTGTGSGGVWELGDYVLWDPSMRCISPNISCTFSPN